MMKPPYWPALALVLFCGAANAKADANAKAAAGHFTFKDWEVACDNTLRCAAAGYQKEEAAEPVVLALSREAGATAAVHVRLYPHTEDGAELGPLTMEIGQTTMRGLRADVELTPEQATRLLPLLLNAETAKVSDGKRSWTLSLAGIKAALLKFDDLQGRVGTPTALAMAGSKPADAVLPPLPAPVVKQLPAVVTRKEDAKLLPSIVKTLKRGGCESPVGIADGDRLNELYRLSAKQVLLVLECARGAYQSSFELWTANDKPPYAPKPVKLPNPVGTTRGYLVNPGFGDGRLSSYSKGRGIGDCNSQALWSWTVDGFKLIEASSAQLCRGVPGGFPLRDYTATVVHPAGQ